MTGPVVHRLGCKHPRPFGNIEVYVEEWLRVSTGEEPSDEFSRSPSLQSSDANLDRSSNATETPASTENVLWNAHTDHRIFLSCSSDLLGLTHHPSRTHC